MFTSTPKDKTTANRSSEADDVQMALALSISTESLRRQSPGFISTQEFIEDESRRSSIVGDASGSKDMFASSSLGQEEQEEAEEAEDGVTGDPLEEVESLALPCFSQFRQTRPVAEEEINETTKERWCGGEVLVMPESKSKFVGQRVKPSVIVQTTRQSVGDCSLRLVRSPARSPHKPTAATIIACQRANMKIGILNKPDLAQEVPLNLQFLTTRMIENNAVMIKLSDGVNQKEFMVDDRFAFMFEEGKIVEHSILTIIKIKKKEGHLVVKNLVVAPMGRKIGVIGDPM